MHAWSITGQIRGKNTLTTYRFVLERFAGRFGKRKVADITSEMVFSFLASFTGQTSQSTRYTWCALLRAFFNHVIDRYQLNMRNPCDSPMISNVFRPPRIGTRTVIDREAVDEVIYTTGDRRDRLLLELMARGGMRIGEVLKLRPEDIDGVKVTLWHPKSGSDREIVFIPRRVAERLRAYVRDQNLKAGDRIFSLTYNGARLAVRRAGKSLGIALRPHDLRRYAATFASRSGVPLEVVSNVILRHKNVSTTQRYLGRVTEAEAMKWIDRIYD
jgi:integrase/recombinase XerD